MKRPENTAHMQTGVGDPKKAQLPKILITRISQKRTIFSLGHSNKSLPVFQERLRTYKIDRVIDVRTRPYSRWCPWFNKNQLEYSLAEADINYDWRGDQLGGLLENVNYEKAIQLVYARAEHENIALLCSEGAYLKCHRYTMLAPDLEALGAKLVHISYK